MPTFRGAVADPVADNRRAHWDPCHPPGVVGQNLIIFCVEWSAKVRTRPRHPPAPSPASGVLDSALTPGPDRDTVSQNAFIVDAAAAAAAAASEDTPTILKNTNTITFYTSNGG
ncbi:hypothetical protein SprV_0100051200 [Sparganum proliferum]